MDDATDAKAIPPIGCPCSRQAWVSDVRDTSDACPAREDGQVHET